MAAALTKSRYSAPCIYPGCDYVGKSNSSPQIARGSMFNHIRAVHDPKFNGRGRGKKPVTAASLGLEAGNGYTGNGRMVPVVDSRGAQVGVREVAVVAEKETYTKEEMDAVLEELSKYKRALRIFQE